MIGAPTNTSADKRRRRNGRTTLYVAVILFTLLSQLGSRKFNPHHFVTNEELLMPSPYRDVPRKEGGETGGVGISHSNNIEANVQRPSSSSSSPSVEKEESSSTFAPPPPPSSSSSSTITQVRDYGDDDDDDDEDFEGSPRNKDDNNNEINDNCQGKGRLVRILMDAGLSGAEVMEQTANCTNLPAWDEVTDLYGSEPVVLGLETCEQYRTILAEKTPPVDTISLRRKKKRRRNHSESKGQPALVRVAGMFNSGTNAMQISLNLNLEGTPRNSAVPWGKHNPARDRWVHTGPMFYGVDKTRVLPVVIVRDPYRWMISMCNEPYEARWQHIRGRCPNLVVKSGDVFDGDELRISSNSTYKIVVPHGYYREGEERRALDYYDSLADMWSTWLKQYYVDADYPRIFVRFEDMLYHAEEVMDKIRQCVGMEESTFEETEEDEEEAEKETTTTSSGEGHAQQQPRRRRRRRPRRRLQEQQQQQQAEHGTRRFRRYRYHADRSKTHGSPSNFASALCKYGSRRGRYDGFSPQDLEYARTALDETLMRKLRYPYFDEQEDGGGGNDI